MNILWHIEYWLKKKFKKPMTLSEFEHWTKLKYNNDTFLYEYKDLRVTSGIVIDAQKIGDLEGLGIEIIKAHPYIYNKND